MSFSPSALIDALGGTTAVARMTKTPPSTVHSWRSIGLNDARLDHLRLAAHSEGLGAKFDAITTEHGSDNDIELTARSSGTSDDVSGAQVAA